MTARHPFLPRSLVALLSISLVSQAVAGTPQEDAAEPSAAGYDQIIARMPVEEAEIAPVALARLTIALHRAKKQAAETLCKGNWFADGELVQRLGPLSIALADHTTVWIYQASRQPAPLACEQVSRAQFFQEMSRHLPEWVSIRPAGLSTAYRLGVPLPPVHPHLAGR